MKTFVIGDIHGAYKGLLQCLERSKFDKGTDTLICLGDVCDGWTEVKQCFDELLTIKNLTFILGNHDEWALDWMKFNWEDNIWTSQGGYNTMKSYGFDRNNVPESHIKLLENAILLYKDKNNNLFVHGGFRVYSGFELTRPSEFLWDRTLIQRAVNNQRIADKQKITPKSFDEFKEIFIGHTTTLCFNTTEPVHACNVWDLDTGGGWSGKVTIMDIDTKEYWQSDFCYDLYPEEKGRK